MGRSLDKACNACSHAGKSRRSRFLVWGSAYVGLLQGLEAYGWRKDSDAPESRHFSTYDGNASSRPCHRGFEVSGPYTVHSDGSVCSEAVNGVQQWFVERWQPITARA